MKLKHILILSLPCLLFITGCGKYENGPAISLRSRTARVTGNWEMNNADLAGNNVTGLYNIFNVKIEENGNYEEVIGVLGLDPVTRIGQWSFSSNFEALNINYDDNSANTVEIKRLAYKELWIEFPTISFVDGSEVMASVQFNRAD